MKTHYPSIARDYLYSFTSKVDVVLSDEEIFELVTALRNDADRETEPFAKSFILAAVEYAEASMRDRNS